LWIGRFEFAGENVFRILRTWSNFAGPPVGERFGGLGASLSANLCSGSTYMSNSNVTREWLIAIEQRMPETVDGLDRNDRMDSETKTKSESAMPVDFAFMNSPWDRSM
jgi:hypothetical protein